jgi:hypothetical protein
VAIAVATVEEIKELFLMHEEEPTRKEQALTMREEKVRISVKALTQVSVALDAERAKAKATQ